MRLLLLDHPDPGGKPRCVKITLPTAADLAKVVQIINAHVLNQGSSRIQESADFLEAAREAGLVRITWFQGLTYGTITSKVVTQRIHQNDL